MDHLDYVGIFTRAPGPSANAPAEKERHTLMDTRSGQIVQSEDHRKLLERDGDLAIVPKRFDDDVQHMLEGVVPSPAFATWAKRTRASAEKKRKRKLAQGSKRRNR